MTVLRRDSERFNRISDRTLIVFVVLFGFDTGYSFNLILQSDRGHRDVYLLKPGNA